MSELSDSPGFKESLRLDAREMTILYVSTKYDYGRPEWGTGFEHNNFYHSLVNMGHEIIYVDHYGLMQKYGRTGMLRRLHEVVRMEKPDLMFSIIEGEELDKKIIRNISEREPTVTLNWFCDDHWRFDSFSKLWAPCFNWVVTTSREAMDKYREHRFPNVIKSQWACNHFLYRKMDLPLKYDVSFVGRPYGNRREIIQAIKQRELRVNTWGRDWDTGRISQPEMIRVFNQSRINLNLSNAGVIAENAACNPGRRLSRRTLTLISALPFGRQMKSAGKRLLRRSVAPKPDKTPEQQPTNYPDQIKGRNFEIPGCGGFLLTNRLTELEHYYLDGREIVCFKTLEELIAKSHYYLQHEDERMAIAQAGHERTLKEHTYVHRFNEIFRLAGLPFDRNADHYIRQTRPGTTVEIN